MAEPYRFVDQHGRPFPKRDLLEEIAAPTVTGVRSVRSDHPAQGLTPQRLAQLMRAAEDGDPKAYLDLAEDMEERDAHYRGVLSTRKNAVRGLDIVVEAGGESPADIEAADLVREVMEGDGLRDDLVDVLDALGKGFSATEIMWKQDGRRWTVERLEWRDPRWFRFDQVDGRTLRLIEGAGEIDLRPWKFVVHYPRTKSGLPIRSGLARLAAWAYLFKNFGLKDWAIFVETYGQPLRLGKYGPEATPDDIRTLLRALRAIGVDMAAAIPRGMEMEFVTAEGARANVDLYEKLVRFWDEQVSKAVLGQVGTTDALAGGYAVGKVHNDVRADICDADADQLAATLRRDLATPLAQFNFGPGVAAPQIKLQRPDEVPLEQLISGLSALVPLGLGVAVADVRKRLTLPEPEEGAELLRVAPLQAAPALSLAAASAGTHSHDTALEDLVDAVIAEGYAERAADQVTAPIASAINTAASLEELAAQLRTLGDRPPPAELVDVLTRVNRAGSLAGMVGASVTDDDG